MLKEFKEICITKRFRRNRKSISDTFSMVLLNTLAFTVSSMWTLKDSLLCTKYFSSFKLTQAPTRLTNYNTPSCVCKNIHPRPLEFH